MTSSSSSSTSKNPPRKHTMLNEEQRSSSNSNCLVIMPQFIQSPFFRKQQQPMNLKPNTFQLLTTTPAATHLVGQLHNSIVSTADRFFNFMQILGSQNPLISKLLSFSSHLQSFRAQVPCRNSRTLDNRPLNHNFAAILPGDSVAGIVATNGVLNFLSIYNTVLVVRLVLTWFPNAPPAIVSPLSTVCDPYLNIFRGIIPPLGGLDLSPILAFLVLNAFTSAASALPAELPKTGVSQNLSSDTTNLTTSQKKWMMRRVAGNKPKSQSGEN